jgi:hypothetical protein
MKFAIGFFSNKSVFNPSSLIFKKRKEKQEEKN